MGHVMLTPASGNPIKTIHSSCIVYNFTLTIYLYNNKTDTMCIYYYSIPAAQAIGILGSALLSGTDDSNPQH